MNIDPRTPLRRFQDASNHYQRVKLRWHQYGLGSREDVEAARIARDEARARYEATKENA